MLHRIDHASLDAVFDEQVKLDVEVTTDVQKITLG